VSVHVHSIGIVNNWPRNRIDQISHVQAWTRHNGTRKAVDVVKRRNINIEDLARVHGLEPSSVTIKTGGLLLQYGKTEFCLDDIVEKVHTPWHELSEQPACCAQERRNSHEACKRKQSNADDSKRYCQHVVIPCECNVWFLTS